MVESQNHYNGDLLNSLIRISISISVLPTLPYHTYDPIPASTPPQLIISVALYIYIARTPPQPFPHQHSLPPNHKHKHFLYTDKSITSHTHTPSYNITTISSHFFLQNATCKLSSPSCGFIVFRRMDGWMDEVLIFL